MEESKILEKQVEALEKLLTLKEAIIIELEKKINRLELDKMNTTIPHYPTIPNSIPSVWTADLCPSSPYPNGLHEYPLPWFGTVPPACKHCGKQSQPSFTVTCNAKEDGSV